MADTARVKTEELIAALEAATGPSRELDAEIANGIGHIVGAFPQSDGMVMKIATKPDNVLPGYWWRDLPRYTASIDAALTLVPEDHFWCITMKGCTRGGFDACCLPEGAHMEWHSGATPAIALCVAALKARTTP